MTDTAKVGEDDGISAILLHVCREFGLTVSEANTEIMSMRSDEYGEGKFDVIVAGHIYEHTNVHILGDVSVISLICRRRLHVEDNGLRGAIGSTGATSTTNRASNSRFGC